MGIVTTTSETAFTQPPEQIYDFVTNPANWPKTYPGSAHVGRVPEKLPLEVGDTWTETGPDGNRIFTWHGDGDPSEAVDVHLGRQFGPRQ